MEFSEVRRGSIGGLKEEVLTLGGERPEVHAEVLGSDPHLEVREETDHFFGVPYGVPTGARSSASKAVMCITVGAVKEAPRALGDLFQQAQKSTGVLPRFLLVEVIVGSCSRRS